MSLSIAETATWAYDLRGEADMLEYVNCLAGPRNAWVNGAITLDDGSTITLDPQAGTYSFEFHDGKPVPETRTATMDPARHPWRTPAPMFPGFDEQLVWRRAITKTLLQHGFAENELPANHQMPLTRHHAELIAPGIEQRLQETIDGYEPDERIIHLLDHEAERLATALADTISNDNAADIAALARIRMTAQDQAIREMQAEREKRHQSQTPA